MRYYEYEQGVQIHVASWPPMFPLAKGVPWGFNATDVASQRASQFLAIEGQAFVLVCTQILTEENLAKQNLVEEGMIQVVRASSVISSLDMHDV